jgi:hypothetical protein
MQASRTRALSALLLAVATVAAGSTPAAAAATSKPFSAVVAPGAVAAGATASFTVTLTNLTSQQQLGSADVTVPTAFVPRSVAVPATAAPQPLSDRTIRLRNLGLPPGGSLTFAVTADVPCGAPSTATWGVVAKQANNFQGPPGNDLTLLGSASSLTTTVSGACRLRFVTQPHAALIAARVTGADFDPAGPLVAVEVIDGSGTRVTSSSAVVTLTRSPLSTGLGTVGAGTATAVAGLATFPSLTLSAAGIYALDASSPGLAGATSGFFRVSQSVGACEPGVTCTATAQSSTRTSVEITSPPAVGETTRTFLTASFGVGEPLTCPGFTPLTPPGDTVLIETTSLVRSKTATLTIPKRLVNASPNNGASFFQVCFGSPEPFTTATGAPAQPQGTFDWNADGVPEPVLAGLLPSCGTAPCVSKRNKTGSGDGVIEMRLPSSLADPKARG